MKRSRAIISLVLLAAVTAFMSFTVFVGLGKDKKGSYHDIRLGLDLAGGASITYQAVGKTPSSEDMKDTIYKLQQRVDEYSTEAQVYQEGTNRIDIEIPGISGVKETNEILQSLGRPGSLYFIRQTDDTGAQNYTMGINSDGKYDYVLAKGKTIEGLIKSGDVVLDGTEVTKAEAGYSQDNMQNQQIVVDLTFSKKGQKAFADATKKALAAGETIGIYYDGKFISVPTVQAHITNGKAQITGEETIESARNLASMIRIGGLKVELKQLQSQIVGAQLGQNAIRTSKLAGIVGFGLVAALMIGVYWLPGLAAVIALFIYVLIEALLLVGFGITLTLPGIAGILLSIGMAVDANVIIFARIREEIAAGKTVKAAVDSGFQKALSAIIDGNVTTLIAAAVLAIPGSGTVKGFATTLALGIVVSMFTALFVTRLIIKILYGLGLRSPKLYGRAKERKPMKFVEHRNRFFAIALAFIAATFILMGVNSARGEGALSYSLDFVGGTATTVTFDKDLSLSEIDKEVVPVFEDVTGKAGVQVQKVTGTKEVVFKTGSLSRKQQNTLSDQLVSKFGVDKDSIQTKTISSTISGEMKRDAVIAVAIALLLMMLYIWLRFRDIRFGASSVFALMHDCLLVLGCYVLTRIAVGSTFIACMLTIVGYSINATIVVFDRVRENLHGRRSAPNLAEVVDLSITQTLSRSLFTSLTTFFMVLTQYIFGVSTMREFALPIMTGVVAGCFSSVCLAGNFWFLLRTKVGKIVEDKGGSGKGGNGGSGSSSNGKRKRDNLSRAERRRQRQREIEAKNRSKITV